MIREVLILLLVLIDVDHLDRGLMIEVVQLELMVQDLVLLVVLLLRLLQCLCEIGEALKVLQFELCVLTENDLLHEHVRRVLILGRLLLQLVVNVLVERVRYVAHNTRSCCTAPSDARPADTAAARHTSSAETVRHTPNAIAPVVRVVRVPARRLHVSPGIVDHQSTNESGIG